MKSIDVIVARDGSSRVETHGYAGGTCRDSSQFIEAALGLKLREQLTADFYRSHVNEQQQVRQQPPGR